MRQGYTTKYRYRSCFTGGAALGPAGSPCYPTYPTRYHTMADAAASINVCSKMFIAFLLRMAPASSCGQDVAGGDGKQGQGGSGQGGRLPVGNTAARFMHMIRWRLSHVLHYSKGNTFLHSSKRGGTNINSY